MSLVSVPHRSPMEGRGHADGRRWLDGLELEGPPGVVEAVRVCESDVAAGGGGLCVATLHVEYGLGYAGLGGDGEAAHAARGAGERRGGDSNGAEGGDDHRRDEGR